MKIIKKKFGFAVVLVFSLLFAILSTFAVFNARRVVFHNRIYLENDAEKMAKILDDEISKGYSNIKILSKLVSNSLTEPEFDIRQTQHLIVNSVFDFMEFADKDGMDHNITGGVTDAHDRKYYLDAKAGNTGMELIYDSRATHETLFMFYSPVYYNDEFVGSLIGVYQADNRIKKMLTEKLFGEYASSYLFSEDGRIIARCNQCNDNAVSDIFSLFSENDKFSTDLKKIISQKKEIPD